MSTQEITAEIFENLTSGDLVSYTKEESGKTWTAIVSDVKHMTGREGVTRFVELTWMFPVTSRSLYSQIDMINKMQLIMSQSSNHAQ